MSEESSYTSSPPTSKTNPPSSWTSDVADSNSKPTSESSARPEPTSPLHIGVTTLQKIFRTLSPSGPWKETEHDNHPNQSKTVTTFYNDTYVSHKTGGKSKDRHKNDKQVYCPEVNNYVDGMGDASFGTPV